MLADLKRSLVQVGFIRVVTVATVLTVLTLVTVVTVATVLTVFTLVTVVILSADLSRSLVHAWSWSLAAPRSTPRLRKAPRWESLGPG